MYGMKMTLHIDDALLARVMEATGATSKTKAIDLALREMDRKAKLVALCSEGLGLAPSTVVGMGADPVVLTDLSELLRLFAADPQTKLVTIVGEVGGVQEERAAEFIAREFRRSGLQPVRGSYFQRIPLAIVDLGAPNVLRIRSGAVERAYELRTDFVPFEITASRAVSGQVVFAGYGITAPALGHDDYAGLDVKGKVVLVAAHVPRESDPASPFRDPRAFQLGEWRYKAANARDHGAAAVIAVRDENGLFGLDFLYKKRF